VIPPGSAGLICRYSTIDKQVYVVELRLAGLKGRVCAVRVFALSFG
jgi:hypothetical protein